MQTTIKRPELKKLFSNKFFTYVVSDNAGHGKVVEVEINVIGKRVNLSYTKIRERN